MTQKTLFVGRFMLLRVMGAVTHKPGLTGTRQTKTNIDEMARSAQNFINIFQRCLGNFKETPILIPPFILARKEIAGVFADPPVTKHGCMHN